MGIDSSYQAIAEAEAVAGCHSRLRQASWCVVSANFKTPSANRGAVESSASRPSRDKLILAMSPFRRDPSPAAYQTTR